jgi:alpha-ketoglutarate-dependent taurine dioxygenase
MSNPQSPRAHAKKLRPVSREAVAVSAGRQALVKTTHLQPGLGLPLVVQPNVDAVDLAAWAAGSREFIEERLARHGGLLFRGFGLRTQADFERAVASMSSRLMHYVEGATPRTQLGDNVYTSTEYPAAQSIDLHNELSYVTTWPTRIWFFCVTPSDEGGETPIADVRRVLGRLSPATVETFRERGWMLVRNFGNGMSLPWQKVFRTDDRASVEEYCRAAQVEFEWVDENHLRTRQVRPALARHSVTREEVWFNHVCFWHVSSLDPEVRASMLAVFPADELPYNTYYGDGSPIADSVVEELREAYRRETVKFAWRAGDLLLLDNMLVAHGRSPYAGSRRVLVAMGEPCSDRGL